jgi:hypothetical protein
VRLRHRVIEATLSRTAGGPAPVGCTGGPWSPGERPLAFRRGPGRVLVGGVGYRWQTDASFGLCASDLLEGQLPPGADAMDLGYGAIYAAQDLAALRPTLERLVLLAGVTRGREPGRLYRYVWRPAHPDPDELQERIREAGAGLVHPDHLLLLGEHFEGLPERVEVWELEPVESAPGDRLTEAARERLAELAGALVAELAVEGADA